MELADKKRLPIFTVDLEDYYNAAHEWPINGPRVDSNTDFILSLLDKYEVKAIFYVLGMTAEEHPDLIKRIVEEGHLIGSHGYLHFHNEKEGDDSDNLTIQILKDMGIESYGYRSPYWYSSKIPSPPAGGFFFRLMSLWYVKWAIKKSGIFWIHPHDVDEEHPNLINPCLNWKRHINLNGAKVKLEKLLKEIKFDDPER